MGLDTEGRTDTEDLEEKRELTVFGTGKRGKDLVTEQGRVGTEVVYQLLAVARGRSDRGGDIRVCAHPQLSVSSFYLAR